jgi:hypothetical protein
LASSTPTPQNLPSEDFEQITHTKLMMPVLIIGGEQTSALDDEATLKVSDFQNNLENFATCSAE